MEITSHDLQHFTTQEQRAKAGIFDPVLFQRKTHKYYCVPLNKTEKCPQDCELCRPTLVRVVAKIGQENGRDPYGALIRLLRREMEFRRLK